MTLRFTPPVPILTDSFSPIGKCVYCGADKDLTKEHIVPYSLEGKWVLPKASCKKCASETTKFERRVCDMHATFRQVNRIQTRHPEKRTGKITVETNEGKDMLIPYEAVSSYYSAIKLKLPGYYRMDEWCPTKSKPGPSKTITGWGVDCELKVVPVPPQNILLFNEYVSKGYTQRSAPYDLEAHALLMAKIGHCLCVGHYGVDNFEHILPPFILGEKEVMFPYKGSPTPVDISFFVGSVPDEVPASPWSNEYEVGVQASRGRYIVFAKIRLFAFLGEPVALVVVGIVKPNKLQQLLAYNEEKRGFAMANHSRDFIQNKS